MPDNLIVPTREEQKEIALLGEAYLGKIGTDREKIVIRKIAARLAIKHPRARSLTVRLCAQLATSHGGKVAKIVLPPVPVT
jgi:hypothetical protein